MKKMKKFLALALAFVVVVTLLPVTGKEVKAANPVKWSAEEIITNENLSTSNTTTEMASAKKTLTKFEKDGLTVETLEQPNKSDTVAYQWCASGKYISGGDNARNNGGAVSGASKAPTSGTALKITVNQSGTIEAVVMGGSSAVAVDKNTKNITGLNFKNIWVTAFDSGETENGEIVYNTAYNFYGTGKKPDVTLNFNAEPGKDYYLFVNGSKGSFKTVTFTPGESGVVYPTVDCLKTKGAAYREPTADYGNGIRFGSLLDTNTFKKFKVGSESTTESEALEDIDIFNEIETGTLVALKSTMDKKGITELTLDDTLGSVVSGAGLKVKRTTYVSNVNKSLIYAVAIVNIPPEQLNTTFVARPYMIIDGKVYYGDQISASYDDVKDKVWTQTNE